MPLYVVNVLVAVAGSNAAINETTPLTPSKLPERPNRSPPAAARPLRISQTAAG
jgi:hypothetical protein